MSIYKCDIPGHQCNADIESGKIVYNKTNPDKDWAYIDYGFMFFKRTAIENFSNETPLDLTVPLQELSDQGLLTGMTVSSRFWEMGHPESYNEFKNQFSTST